MLGDLSPIAQVLTEADAAFIDAAMVAKFERETEHRLIWEDVRFLLLQQANLSAAGQRFMPSYKHYLGKRLEARMGE